MRKNEPFDDDFDLIDLEGSAEESAPAAPASAPEGDESHDEASFAEGEAYDEEALTEDEAYDGEALAEDEAYDEDAFAEDDVYDWDEPEGDEFYAEDHAQRPLTFRERRALKKQAKREARSLRAANGDGRRRGFLYYAIPIALISLILISGTFFLRDFLAYKTASDEYKALERFIVIPTEEEEQVEAAPAEEEDSYPLLEVQFDELLHINQDLVGVLYVPALDLVYPVVHSHDNAEYLNRTFEGKTNASGSIFLDCYASRDLSDSHAIIYGHNMKNGTMFGSLKRFATAQGYTRFAEDPFFYIYTRNQVFRYEIFSFHTTPVDSYVYDGYYGDNGYNDFVAHAEADYQVQLDSLGEEPLHEFDFSEYPRLMTLSTCWGTGHVYNFVVHGVLTGLFDQE